MKIRKFCVAVAIMMMCLRGFTAAAEAGDAIACAAFAGEPYFAENVTAENGYMICLSEEEFEAHIACAGIYRPEFSAGGGEIWLIRVKADGGETAKLLSESYEQPPCDPAEVAAIAFANENILFAKGSADGVRAALSAFEDIYGISTIEYIKDNV